MRPRPISGEASLGFLARVAEANGYNSILQLWQSLKTWENVTVALGLTSSEVECLFGCLPGYWRGADEISSGLTASDVNHAHLRWCPLCLMDTKHIRGIWMLKLCCVCTEHRILLHEKCPKCGSRQEIHRTMLERCVCGKRKTSGTIKAAPIDLIKITLAMEQSFYGLPDQSVLPALGIQNWLKLALYLGQYTENNQPERPGQLLNLHEMDIALGVMTNVANLLDQWPANFLQLLTTIHQQNSEQTSLRKTFGKLLNVLYRQLYGLEFQFLRDAFEGYLIEHWQGLLCNRHRLFKKETVSGHPQLTIKKVAWLSQSPPSLVRHLIEAELVPGFQSHTAKKRRINAINRQQIHRIAELTKTSLNLLETAKSLQLPKRRVRLLIAAGIIKPLVSRSRFNAASWHIQKKELTKLWFKPELNDEKLPVVCISAILKYWRLSDNEFTELVNALVSGILKPVSGTKERVPIGQVQLCKAQFRHWLYQMHTEELSAFSVDSAAKELNIKQQVAYGLVKKGLLPAIFNTIKGYRISPDQLQDFQRSYVSLAHLAQRTGSSPRKLLQQINATPITGPGVDGSRQYFYRRSDLPSEQIELMCKSQ